MAGFGNIGAVALVIAHKHRPYFAGLCGSISCGFCSGKRPASPHTDAHLARDYRSEAPLLLRGGYNRSAESMSDRPFACPLTPGSVLRRVCLNFRKFVHLDIAIGPQVDW